MLVLKDYVNGKLLFNHSPPNLDNKSKTRFFNETQNKQAKIFKIPLEVFSI